MSQKKRVFVTVRAETQLTEEELKQTLLEEANRQLEKNVLHTLNKQMYEKGVVDQDIYYKAVIRINELK